MTDVDLFAGAGGASEGLRRAGVHAIGYERWEVACRSHDANGHATVQADLATYDWTGHPPVRLMWASPPCQPFSAAGDQDGEFDDRDGIPWWLRAVDELRPDIIVMENVRGLTFDKHRAYLSGVIASVHALGYELDWKVLDAADYGVPQNRERFILIGRRDGGRIAWPTVTHTEGGGLFTKPWVSMAEALGWGYDDTVDIQRGAGMLERYGERHPRVAGARPSPAIRAGTAGSGNNLRRVLNTGRDWKPGGSRVDAQTIDPAARPAPAVTGIAVTQWQLRHGDELAPVEGFRLGVADESSASIQDEIVDAGSDQFGIGIGGNSDSDIDGDGAHLQHNDFSTPDVKAWCYERPATVVMADPRIFQPGGHHQPGEQSQNAVRVEVWEAAVLQGFPADYIFCGGRTDQATQVGNAVPPPLAEAIVRALLEERAA